MELITTIVAFIFVISVLVFFHELGHFAVARFFNTKISAFSIGFGPEIYGWNDRHGTRWRVSWIPLGGYVKFEGDENAASVPSREQLEEMRASGADTAHFFHFKPLYQRALIVAAGPFANFLLAAVIFAVLAMTVGVRATVPRVDAVVPNMPAAEAGFEPGDIVLEIDGRAVDSFDDMHRIIASNPEQELAFLIERSGDSLTLRATPILAEVPDGLGNVNKIGQLGISYSPTVDERRFVRYGPISAMGYGIGRTYDFIGLTLRYIGGIFIGTQSTDQLGGPLRIAQLSGQVAAVSFDMLLGLMAVLSVSIGLINLFPIPMLDGGHLLFYAFEAVAGRPLSERTQEIGFRIGLALLLALMVFATWNDLMHLKVFGS